MNLILNLTPEAEAKLLEQAKAAGKAPEDFVLEAIEEKVAGGDTFSESILPLAEWKARLRSWVERHPRQTHEVDVSRESIYRGRGE